MLHTRLDGAKFTIQYDNYPTKKDARALNARIRHLFVLAKQLCFPHGNNSRRIRLKWRNPTESLAFSCARPRQLCFFFRRTKSRGDRSRTEKDYSTCSPSDAWQEIDLLVAFSNWRPTLLSFDETSWVTSLIFFRVRLNELEKMICKNVRDNRRDFIQFRHDENIRLCKNFNRNKKFWHAPLNLFM